MLALRRSSRKIIVFLFTILSSVVILGSIMYVIEAKADSGFTSIPESVYWAVVTLTTVGYGDISPQTPFGQFFASLIMVLGYTIIAVPTSIVTIEMSRAKQLGLSFRTCSSCDARIQDGEAIFCKLCGAKLKN
jgi:voltage-gated potassium channel